MIYQKMTGWLFLLLVVIGCSEQHDLDRSNSIYYWRTELRLDSTERDFLAKYHIRKMYCRYFDVVINREGDGPVPNATISFSSSFPQDVEVVPTVYITENCMHEWHESLAEKLVQRIRQMNETNDIEGVREIQIDCDYTAKSRRLYYRFLEDVKKAWGGCLSATIRLHQLSMEAPPVDYGVLMVYNTGNPQNYTERNPILDLRDVTPYLRYVSDYPLPMAAAYPVFSWLRTIQGVYVTHTVEADEILRVQTAIEQKRPTLGNAVVTYHLDKENINRYKQETYEKIYHH